MSEMPSIDQLIGKRFGPESSILIESKIGEGGMGVVYRGWDSRRERPVAVKFLLPERVSDREIVSRFKREGRKFSAIRHPNLVRIYTLGREQGLIYIASEFVPGRTIFDMITADGPFEIDEALRICRDVASGLAAAHEQRVVHRDLKPENIMVRDDDRVVKVLDFGIAKHMDASVVLTRLGTYIGTPAYSAPEQIRGEEIDHRADVFALGVILYELLTGKVAFDGRHTMDVLKATLRDRPIPISRVNNEVTTPVAGLIDRMIQKKPHRRYQSMDEVVEDVERAMQALGEGYSEEEKGGIRGLLRKIFEGV